MLSIKFEQTGKIDDDQRRQARAIVTTLHALFGPSILPTAAIEISGAEYPATLAASTAPTPDAVKSHLASTTAPAPDGYPTENPAAAFGDTDTSAAEAFSADPAPTADNVERDVDGTPYDKRIHAETKTKTAKGVWTRRRNTPDHLFEDVMKELKAGNTARTIAAAAAIPAPPAGGAVPLPPSTAPAPTSSGVPAPSPAPAAPAASSIAPGGELAEPADTFPKMMVKITKAQAAGRLTPDTLTGILIAAGAEPDAAGKVSMMAMNKNAALIPLVDALLSEHLGA